MALSTNYEQMLNDQRQREAQQEAMRQQELNHQVQAQQQQRAQAAQQNYLQSISQPVSQGVNANVYNAALNTVQNGGAKSYQDQLNDIYNQIQNREQFKYDVNADPLYNAYKDNFIQGGKLAMRDTMGKAAALTGGYGTSYGQQVGQQAYDAYLQNLSDAIPELYNMAFSRYQDEGNRLNNLYGLASAEVEREYSRGRDALADERYAQELARQQEQQDYERRIYAENLEYNKQQDAKKNVLAMIQLGAKPTDAELAAAGITRDQANAIYGKLFPAAPAASSGGGNYYVGSSSSSSKKNDDNKEPEQLTRSQIVSQTSAAIRQGKITTAQARTILDALPKAR